MAPGPRPAEEAEEGLSSQALSTNLDPALLRGVPLHVALAGCGRHWTNAEGGQFRLEASWYQLSQPTKSFDAFLSHDWASSGLLKVLSLLIVFNSAPAFLACVVVTVLLGLLRGFGLVPDQGWTVAFGHLAFLAVFFFWQRLRHVFLRSPIVFLDKLCVAQHDEQLKKQGILGIAAFLLSSDQLIVLLSPEYCNRLWCTFELATFMKDPERRKRIQLMPLKATAFLLMFSGGWFALSLAWSIFDNVFYTTSGVVRYGDDYIATGLVLTGIMFLFSFAGMPLIFFLGMGLMADMEKSLEQLTTFKVQDASCFCCSNNHRHPHTGAELPCDRRMVYNMLKRWYGNSDNLYTIVESHYLDRFSQLVRDELAPNVALLVGGYRLPANYTVYMVLVSAVPYFADHLSLWISRVQSGLSGYTLTAFTLRQVVEWGTVPLAGLLFVSLTLPLSKAGIRLQWKASIRSRWCLAFSLAFACLVLIVLMWAPPQFALSLTGQEDLVPVAIFLGWVCVACVLYIYPRCSTRWLEGQSVEEPAADDTFSI